MSYPTPAVSAVIFDSRKRVLLTLRSKRASDSGKWRLPGGPFAGGGDWLQMLGKEVKREVGLQVAEAKLVAIYSDPKLHVGEVGGVKTHFLTASFLVTRYEGEVVTNEEADRYDWFGVDELPDSLLPADALKVKDAFQFEGDVFVR